MKPGDLVTVMYEKKQYYIILQIMGKEFPGEERYKLFGSEGDTRYVFKSEIRLINESR